MLKVSFQCSKTRFHHLFKRGLSTHSTSTRSDIVHIPKGSSIFAFGSPSETRSPLIKDVGWTIQEGEAWAVVSGAGGGKGVIFDTLLGHTRIEPPSIEAKHSWTKRGGLYPFLSSWPGDPYFRISHVSFRQRSAVDSGAFFDYTARYGAMHDEEDRVTLRESLQPRNVKLSNEEQKLLQELTQKMNIDTLLDLPMVTLSNGQTRRARIIKAVMGFPELLLLDEPLAGLDLVSRTRMHEALRKLHEKASPRIIIGLRHGEDVPDWISHILEVKGSEAIMRCHTTSTGPAHPASQPIEPEATSTKAYHPSGKVLAELQNVCVAYKTRKILQSINWQIKQGDRWHLQGANGSGKTTLLAILVGDHPQSFIQPHLLLPALSSRSSEPTLLPRSKIPTAHLRRVIGVSSPEMFDAFPRRHPGMSVWEAVGTGFDGGFVPRTKGAESEARKMGGIGWVDVSEEEVGVAADQSGKEWAMESLREWRVTRCWEVLECLGPASWTGKGKISANPWPSDPTRAFASLSFSLLSVSEQRLVLLMRALVNKPPLVLLDEAWSGMDEEMISAARRYLRGEVEIQDGAEGIRRLQGVDETQAVVVITHWTEEVPWQGDEVKRFKLSDRA